MTVRWDAAAPATGWSWVKASMPAALPQSASSSTPSISMGSDVLVAATSWAARPELHTTTATGPRKIARQWRIGLRVFHALVLTLTGLSAVGAVSRSRAMFPLSRMRSRRSAALPQQADETDDEGDGERRVGHQRSEHPSDHARFQV